MNGLLILQGEPANMVNGVNTDHARIIGKPRLGPSSTVLRRRVVLKLGRPKPAEELIIQGMKDDAAAAVAGVDDVVEIWRKFGSGARDRQE